MKIVFNIDFVTENVTVETTNALTFGEGGGSGGAVDSVNGETGVVVLTTSDIAEGSRLYFTAARVLASLLTGLSTATNSLITASDSVLIGFGKLQAQITALSNSLSNYVTGGASSADNSIAVYNGTTGKIIKDGLVKSNRIINSLSMGLVSGGNITINADPTKFNISAGKGVIVDNYTDVDNPVVYEVTWNTFTAVTPTFLGTNTSSQILIDRTGAIRQQAAFPTPEEHRDYIYLGQLGHANLTSINAVINRPEVAISSSDQLKDFEDFIGIVNTGNLISANGSNLSINKSEGYFYATGSNFATSNKNPNIKYLSAQILASLRLRTQTGNGATGVTVIDPANYDVGGVITNISGTRFTNQRVFLTISGNIVIQYGQTLYNTQSLAIQGISRESFVVFENVQNNAALIGIITVRNNATNLSDTAQALITYTSKFGEVNAAGAGISVSTLQNAYNNSETPEITTDSTRGAVTFKRGSASDTNDVIEVLKGDNTKVFAVTGEGNVTATNLSGTNTGNETTSTLGATINGATAATPNDTDLVATVDTSVLKKITWTNVKAFLKTYFDTLYSKKFTELYITTGDQTRTTNTLVDIVGLTFTIEPNKRYSICGRISIGCNNTGGVQLALVVPGTSTMVFSTNGLTNLTTAFITERTGVSGALSSIMNTQNRTQNPIDVYAEVTSDATGGICAFQFQPVTNTQTATIHQANTLLIVTELI